MGLVLDTSGLYALIDRREPDHARCNATASEYSERFVPALVLSEVDYWCRKRGGGPQAFQLLSQEITSGVYILQPLTEEDLARAAELEVSYADLDLGLVDASVIALCERLGEEAVLSLDRRDFAVVRPRHCTALHLLPD